VIGGNMTTMSFAEGLSSQDYALATDESLVAAVVCPCSAETIDHLTVQRLISNGNGIINRIHCTVGRPSIFHTVIEKSELADLFGHPHVASIVVKKIEAPSRDAIADIPTRVLLAGVNP